jgi:sporulation protein YlmC with PRC-barrel domain
LTVVCWAQPASTAPADKRIDAPEAQPPAAETDTARDAPYQRRSTTAPMRASRIVGMDLRNVLGEPVGNIHEVVIDPYRAQVLFAVVSVHGVLGNYDDRYFPVPWTVLRPSGNYFVITTEAAAHLKNGPTFERGRWPDLTSDQWIGSVYEFYNQRPPERQAAR